MPEPTPEEPLRWRTENPEYVQFKPVECPVCGYAVDSAKTVDGRRVMPVNDDFNICFNCAEPSRFVVGSFGVSLRACTIDERNFAIAKNRNYIGKLRAFNDFRQRIRERLGPDASDDDIVQSMKQERATLEHAVALKAWLQRAGLWRTE